MATKRRAVPPEWTAKDCDALEDDFTVDPRTGARLTRRALAEARAACEALTLWKTEVAVGDIVCAAAGGVANVVRGACTPLGGRVADGLIRVAATRVFSDPTQAVLELVVNGIDAHRTMAGAAPVGRFGLGFFSILYYAFATPGRVVRLESCSYEEDGRESAYELTLRVVDGRLLVKLTDAPPWPRTGTRVTLQNSLPPPSQFNYSDRGRRLFEECNEWHRAVRQQVEKLRYIPDAMVTLDGDIVNRDMLEESGTMDQPYVPSVKVSTRPYSNEVVVEDDAGGIPRSIALRALLVPSSSSKGMSAAAAGGGSGSSSGSSSSPVPYVRTEVHAKTHALMLCVNGVGVVHATVQPTAADTVDGRRVHLLGLNFPPSTRLAVSRDELLVETDAEAAALRSGLRALATLAARVTRNLVPLVRLVAAYAAASSQPRVTYEVDAFFSWLTGAGALGGRVALTPTPALTPLLESMGLTPVVHPRPDVGALEAMVRSRGGAALVRSAFALRDALLVEYAPEAGGALVGGTGFTGLALVSVPWLRAQGLDPVNSAGWAPRVAAASGTVGVPRLLLPGATPGARHAARVANLVGELRTVLPRTAVLPRSQALQALLTQAVAAEEHALGGLLTRDDEGAVVPACTRGSVTARMVVRAEVCGLGADMLERLLRGIYGAWTSFSANPPAYGVSISAELQLGFSFINLLFRDEDDDNSGVQRVDPLERLPPADVDATLRRLDGELMLWVVRAMPTACTDGGGMLLPVWVQEPRHEAASLSDYFGSTDTFLFAFQGTLRCVATLMLKTAPRGDQELFWAAVRTLGASDAHPAEAAILLTALGMALSDEAASGLSAYTPTAVATALRQALAHLRATVGRQRLVASLALTQTAERYDADAFAMESEAELDVFQFLKRATRAAASATAAAAAAELPPFPSSAATTVSAQALLAALFDRPDLTPSNFLESLPWLSKYTPPSDATRLQALQIAVNAGTSKEFVAAVLTELYQNSLDATRRAGGGGSISVIAANDALGMRDGVGIPDGVLLPLLVPFLSTKTAGDDKVTGEMGTGFFNVFRQPYVADVRIRTVNATHAIDIRATPQVSGAQGAVTDVTYEVVVAAAGAAARGTTVLVRLRPSAGVADGALRAEALLFAHTCLGLATPPDVRVDVNGMPLGDAVALEYESPLVQLWRRDGGSKAYPSVVLTNGVPFSDLAALRADVPFEPELLDVADGVVLNLRAGGYTPTQARNRLAAVTPQLTAAVSTVLVRLLMRKYYAARVEGGRSGLRVNRLIGNTSSEADLAQLVPSGGPPPRPPPPEPTKWEHVRAAVAYAAWLLARVPRQTILARKPQDSGRRRTLKRAMPSGRLLAALEDLLDVKPALQAYEGVLGAWFGAKRLFDDASADDAEATATAAAAATAASGGRKALLALLTAFVRSAWRVGAAEAAAGRLRGNIAFPGGPPSVVLRAATAAESQKEAFYELREHRITVLDRSRLDAAAAAAAAAQWGSVAALADALGDASTPLGALFAPRPGAVPTIVHELAHAWRGESERYGDRAVHGPSDVGVGGAAPTAMDFDPGAAAVYAHLCGAGLYEQMHERMAARPSRASMSQ